MADKFMQHEGVETGYFAKRKSQFNDEIGKGITQSTGGKQSGKVNNSKDAKKTPKPAPKEEDNEDK